MVPKIRLDPAVLDYMLDLVESTRQHEQLHLGVSTRGALALTSAAQAAALVAGRDYVQPDDVKRMFIPVCGHRVISKSYLNNGDTENSKRILQTILDSVPTPR